MIFTKSEFILYPFPDHKNFNFFLVLHVSYLFFFHYLIQIKIIFVKILKTMNNYGFCVSESPPPPYCLIADRLRPEGKLFWVKRLLFLVIDNNLDTFLDENRLVLVTVFARGTKKQKKAKQKNLVRNLKYLKVLWYTGFLNRHCEEAYT